MLRHINRSQLVISLALLGLPTFFAIRIGSIAARPSKMPVHESAEIEPRAYLPLITIVGMSFPDVPTLISPDNNDSLQTLVPTFIWDMGSHPEGTIVRPCLAYSNSQDFLTMCSIIGGIGSNDIQEAVPLFNLLADTIYFWRVGFVYDFNYDDIHWSETRTFRTGPSGGAFPPPPIHLSPPNASPVPEQEIVLKWDDIPGASQYSVSIRNIDTGDEYGWVYYTETQLSLSSMNYWGIKPGESYEWSVSVRNAYAWSEASTPWSFSVIASMSNDSDNALSLLSSKENATRKYGQD